MAIRRNGRARERVVSQMFHIPEGLEDVIYSVEDETDLWFDPEDEPPDEDEKASKKKKNKNKKKKKNKDDNDKGKRGINTPKTFDIIKQVIRTKADGSQVIDLTVEVDRIIKANKYEFRLTKKDTGKTTTQTDN